MNLVQFALILKARLRVLLAFVILGLLLSLLWVWSSPLIYQSTAQLLVTVRAPDMVTVAGDQNVASQLQPDYLATQVDVIKSDRVAVAAVKKLGIDQDPAALTQYRNAGSPGAPSMFFADRLRGSLRVLPSASSRVISLTYASQNPQTAATVANAFADAYRDTSLALQIEPARQASSWYESSAADLRKKLDKAQEALSLRRAALGVTAPNDQAGDAEDARLGALSQQLASAQAAQAVQNARATGGALPDTMTSPVVQSLLSDISRVEAQRSQLATFAGPNNVDYQQLTNQLAKLRSELAQQKALVAQSASTSSAQSAQSTAALQAAVDTQRRRVIDSQRSRGDIASLEQDVMTLKNTYEQIVARQAQATLLGATSQTNVTLLSPATVPLRPSGLPKTFKVLVGLFGGILLGLLAAVCLEFLDQRLRRPEDAPVWLGIPNLGGVRTLSHRDGRLIGQSVRRYLPRPSEGSAL